MYHFLFGVLSLHNFPIESIMFLVHVQVGCYHVLDMLDCSVNTSCIMPNWVKLILALHNK